MFISCAREGKRREEKRREEQRREEKGREEKECNWIFEQLTLRLHFVDVALFLITGHSNFKPNVQGIPGNESQIVRSLCLLVSEKREGMQLVLPRTHSQECP